MLYSGLDGKGFWDTSKISYILKRLAVSIIYGEYALGTNMLSERDSLLM